MRITIVVAMAREGAIGLENRLLCHLPEDLQHFKRLTMGGCLIMGRRTWESIGRPLPGRQTIVISSNASFPLPAGVLRADSPAGAIAMAEGQGREECFIVGGAQIYRAFIPLATRLVITHIDQTFEADAFFPLDLLEANFHPVADSGALASANGTPYAIREYEPNASK